MASPKGGVGKSTCAVLLASEFARMGATESILLVFSFPVHSDGAGGWRIVQDLPLSDFARSKIQATLTELREEREVIQDLLK